MALEHFLPHKADLAQLAEYRNPYPVLPLIAGLTIGLNQIPLRLLTGDGQGGSTSIMTMVSTLTAGYISPRFFPNAPEKVYQLVYVYGGTGLGALLTTLLAASHWSAPTGVDGLPALVGGMLMIFGARFAAGCTCGHGISGMSELSFTSIAGAMSIFAGGIATGFIWTFVL